MIPGIIQDDSLLGCYFDEAFPARRRGWRRLLVFDVEEGGYGVSLAVDGSQGVPSGGGLKGDLVEILCLPHVLFVHVPVNGACRVVVCQFCFHEAAGAVHLQGQGYAGVVGGIDELHRAQGVFAASRCQGGKGGVLGVLAAVIPFPHGRECEPCAPDGGVAGGGALFI